jgi:hypothetical protein
MTFNQDHLIGVRVRIVLSNDLGHDRMLDIGNGVGTIVALHKQEISSDRPTIAFVRIDKPGEDWNAGAEKEHGRGWWFRMDALTLLNEDLP